MMVHHAFNQMPCGKPEQCSRTHSSTLSFSIFTIIWPVLDGFSSIQAQVHVADEACEDVHLNIFSTKFCANAGFNVVAVSVSVNKSLKVKYALMNSLWGV